MGGLGAPAEGGRNPDPAAPPAARLRWVRSANLHLTLRFLGATPAAALPALEAAIGRTASGLAPFEARLAGAGAFPSPARPRAVFLRVTDGAASLGALADGLAAELAAGGWPPGERPFEAHLTLARSDGVPGASPGGRRPGGRRGVARRGLERGPDRALREPPRWRSGPLRRAPQRIPGRAHLAGPGRRVVASWPRPATGEPALIHPPREPRRTAHAARPNQVRARRGAIPRAWYNVVADLPSPPPPALHPGTLQPLGPDDLAPLFPMALIAQEVSTDREVEIPDPVRDAYRLYRPSPLFRARRLEKVLDTPAHIYYKYEGLSPAGSHKPNTAIPQAFYNAEAGVKRLATETGAGQWGTALAIAGALFGLEVKVYMVRASYDQKPYRRMLMETYGASVVASPSPTTNHGRAVLAGDAGQPGIARDGDQRGGRGRRDARRHEVRARVGAQPRPAPPDGDRPGGDPPDGDGRRGAGRRDRLRRRRIELLRARLPVRGPDAPRRGRPTG